MTKHMIEPYRVFKQHKDELDKIESDLLRRIYLRNIYRDTAKHLLHVQFSMCCTDIINEVYTKDPKTSVMGLKFKRWAEELDQEIWASLKGMRFPLYVECY